MSFFIHRDRPSDVVVAAEVGVCLQLQLPVDLYKGQRPRGQVLVEDEEGQSFEHFEVVDPALRRLLCKIRTKVL